jgi:hypothetical protein
MLERWKWVESDGRIDEYLVGVKVDRKWDERNICEYKMTKISLI